MFKKQFVATLIIVGICWSWLFLVDVARLTDSVYIGYGIITVAYLILVTISGTVITLSWKYINHFLNKPSVKSLVIFITLWAATEYILAWILSAVWMGRGGSWDNMLPFISLTPLIIKTPLSFLTRVFGYFGTSAIVGTGIILLFQGKLWRKYTITYWGVIIAVCTFMWVIYNNPVGSRITTVTTSEKLGEHQKVNAENADLVILPEYGLDDYTSKNIAERFTENTKNVDFSGTKQLTDSQGNHNILVFGSISEGFTNEQSKSRLIVGGEHLSYGAEVFTSIFATNIYDNFTVRRAVVKGNQAVHPHTFASRITIGNAACSSIISPSDYRRLTNSGAEVLANSASLEIFRGSRLFGLYHDGFAKFMAVANARPFLQSANNWKAFALDHNGKLVAYAKPVSQATATITTNTRKTPYTVLGEWVAYSGFVQMLFLALKVIVKKFKIQPSK